MQLRYWSALLFLGGAAHCSTYGADEPATPVVAVDGGDADGGLDASDAPSDAGGCAHDCGGGSCVDGRCRPYVLVENVIAPFEIAVDDTFVYWTSLDYADAGGSGVVGKVDKRSGGDPKEIRALQNSFGITEDGARLAVTGRRTAASGQAVHLLDKVTGEGPEIGVGTGPLQAVVRGELVYWTSAQGALFSAQLDGGAPQVRASKPDGGTIFEGIAADQTHVYFTHLSGSQGSLGRVNIASGVADSPWASGESNPRRIALDEDAVYWMGASTPGNIRRRAKASGTLATTLLDGISTGWGGIAVDDTHLYATLAPEGRVVRMDKRTGAGLVDVATGLVEPNGIAVDAEALYFVERAKNRIWRLVK